MVSTKILNGVLIVIKNFMLDKKCISELSNINLNETKYALDVLVSHGYVLRSHSKGINDEGQKYSYVYYVASESAKEILNDGGFTKQLSMKEKSKTSVKNKLSIKDCTVNGQVNQGSLLEKNETIVIKQTSNPQTNEKQQSAIVRFIDKWFWQIIIPLVLGITLITIESIWFK